MRAILTGAITNFRYANLKAGKVGQIDLLQAGNDHYVTKIIPLYIPSAAYCRLILESLSKGDEPIASFLCWMTNGKEIEIDVIEMLSITSPIAEVTNDVNS